MRHRVKIRWFLICLSHASIHTAQHARILPFCLFDLIRESVTWCTVNPCARDAIDSRIHALDCAQLSATLIGSWKIRLPQDHTYSQLKNYCTLLFLHSSNY
jgi:hypothetical protein